MRQDYTDFKRIIASVVLGVTIIEKIVSICITYNYTILILYKNI